MKYPNWANLSINKIIFQNIKSYSRPKKKWLSESIVDPALVKTFEKVGFAQKLNKKKFPEKKLAIDAVFDSVSIYTTYKEQLAKLGIIFCSISEATRLFNNVFAKFFGLIVSDSDNYFAALNAAVYSDGSFCYIPQNTSSPVELSTYFRVNDMDSGQFERTLIVAEKNAIVNYLEGCTASQYSKNQLHAAIVELLLFENAQINYSTVQNWYSGNSSGVGGIYNFVTKRALCLGKNASVKWTQVEVGSAITWKYPSCVLIGNQSSGEFYSIALTSQKQQADTGTKMLHLGSFTKSNILSKNISSYFSSNSYRGLIKISSNALFSKSFSQCDSFLLGKFSSSNTYPYLDCWNQSSYVEHEAKISKLNEAQLFYFLQRGIPEFKAISLMVTAFCKNIVTLLPLEFAMEANKLLSLKLKGGLG